MGLSSGTLGLKFMNRAQPAGVQAAPNKDKSASASSTPSASNSRPSSAASTSRGAAPARSSGATKSTQHAGLASESTAVANQAGQVALDRDEDWSRRTVAGQSGCVLPSQGHSDSCRVLSLPAPSRSRRTVVHESSLLSFPLLSTLNSAPSTSTSSFSSTATSYSSMPLTAGAISGRRSYGGANVEIEVRWFSLQRASCARCRIKLPE